MPLRAKVINSAFAGKMSTATGGSKEVIKELEGDEKEDVLFDSLFGLRTIELNRPKKLHSLNGSMARKIVPRLQEWAKSDMANVVVIKGSGEKAFCAGGDVTQLAKDNTEGPEGQKRSTDYFALEYKLDHLIATYTKPYVAFMDGVTMGGGVGLSIHAPFRIATERTVFAMPETTIGFFPDVGASFFLPRMPGAVGTYLALTSDKVKGVNVYYSGIATHYIHSTSLPALERRLAELRFKDYQPLAERLELINSTIDEYSTGLPHDEPIHIRGKLRQTIDRIFSLNSVEEVISALTDLSKSQGDLQEWATQTLSTIKSRSPTAVYVAFRQMKLGKKWSIKETFQREHQIAAKFMQHPDFTEGVHALLIRKDGKPQWKPATLEEVGKDPTYVDSFFTVEGQQRLQLLNDKDYNEYPFQFGIPGENDVEAESFPNWHCGQQRLAMSSPASMSHAQHQQRPTMESQSSMIGMDMGSNEDGVSVRPMRLKVLYTFDDQNKTNCLARWPHVLQIQTVAMDETTSIGVIELKTCIQAIVQCSPELVARLGQDYTVYAYDFSEYDNPLVGQGMLSWALAAASPGPDAPAHQSNKLITGRVCKNILGLFANGVKETLEVKLRLVPVPTVLQSEYINAMEKYRELSKVIPTGFDANEWTAFLQSNPNITQLAQKMTPAPTPNPTQRDGTSMEVVNQLLSPSMQQQNLTNSFNQPPQTENPAPMAPTETASSEKAKPTSRPASRTSTKRVRKPRPKKATTTGGNTSGYEEGTDGDDGPATKKRAKITKADWNSKSTIGSAQESLRVAASTSGSLRMFRPIAMSPLPPGGSHLQEIPRAPTPVPHMANQHLPLDRPSSQSGLRRDSFQSQSVAPQQHHSPYPVLEKPEDQPRCSIESANASPERNESPADTPPEIGSSPPVMRTRPPSRLASSPPCPSSPILPQMPRTDSGFMSGSLGDLFGEEDNTMPNNDNDEVEVQEFNRQPAAKPASPMFDSGFVIEEETPGPMDLLPTKMLLQPVPVPKAKPSKRVRSRAGSVMSEDGQQTLPPLRKESRPTPSGLSMPLSQQPEIAPTRPLNQPSPAANSVRGQSPAQPLNLPSPATNSFQGQLPVQPLNHVSPYTNTFQRHSNFSTDCSTSSTRTSIEPSSRSMIRTASMGALSFPEVPTSDPVLPPSTLHRSHTWSEAPHPTTEAPMPQPKPMQPAYQPLPEDYYANGEYSEATLAKRNSIRQKLEAALERGEMPPFCNNCGAIETPTWRKAWSQDRQGTPGYYEYSDEAGKVTCVNILTRDEQGQPTSYQLIKKFLAPEENQNDFNEYLLCNPCGIWMSKYKVQRPENKWERYEPIPRKGADLKVRERKRPTQRPSKPKKAQNGSLGILTSDVNFPPSDANFPQSEAYFPQSEVVQQQRGNAGPPEGVSPVDTTGTSQQQNQQSFGTNQAQEDRRRSMSSQPPKRLKAMTSDAASAALRRAIQSSPARWQGTRQSPIDIEDDSLGSTRRLLFPSPRKDGSPKVLGEVVANVVQVATEFRSPKEAAMEKF
ncbi:hypothetical protein G7Y89_g15178 [Cudoniella acicularis]|uniref:3-hydroxyisobutyryl-CoA hydrolase n=1 Tax=Cudoniella acicularis TaxID=354080 RepID=A0A8H4VN97_9HELO|nr:hypothetical protein G7Y89_g15178 [Cudoniella acicularis]